MKKSISRTEKRGRGRPATNPTSIHLTLEPGPLSEVDRWTEKQKEQLSRPEAIRRLVEIGLTVRTKSKQPTTARAERAKTLAWKTLESLTLAAADDDEKTSRKRRLIKGPEEFQGVRIDQPPAPSGKKPIRSG